MQPPISAGGFHISTTTGFAHAKSRYLVRAVTVFTVSIRLEEVREFLQ
jgi:hypothetical protein